MKFLSLMDIKPWPHPPAGPLICHFPPAASSLETWPRNSPPPHYGHGTSATTRWRLLTCSKLAEGAMGIYTYQDANGFQSPSSDYCGEPDLASNANSDSLLEAMSNWTTGDFRRHSPDQTELMSFEGHPSQSHLQGFSNPSQSAVHLFYRGFLRYPTAWLSMVVRLKGT